jgi:hypothetical protein
MISEGVQFSQFQCLVGYMSPKAGFLSKLVQGLVDQPYVLKIQSGEPLI